ncbi:hypothetical protein GE061_015820 [Apolygus lucorum]|uniref:Uncharacterized protein n=1 Tax=Apolygus lucorum TaxID=248454 RepID=A0A8S9XN84_APOLU|nr:hypothetical protein GE061_015820 [Apolygus lucorum]
MTTQRQSTFRASEAALQRDFITLREHANKVNWQPQEELITSKGSEKKIMVTVKSVQQRSLRDLYLQVEEQLESFMGHDFWTSRSIIPKNNWKSSFFFVNCEERRGDNGRGNQGAGAPGYNAICI